MSRKNCPPCDPSGSASWAALICAFISSVRTAPGTVLEGKSSEEEGGGGGGTAAPISVVVSSLPRSTIGRCPNRLNASYSSLALRIASSPCPRASRKFSLSHPLPPTHSDVGVVGRKGARPVVRRPASARAAVVVERGAQEGVQAAAAAAVVVPIQCDNGHKIPPHARASRYEAHHCIRMKEEN